MARKQRPTKSQPTYREPDFDIREGETPEQYYKRLAKVADQRLVRLEKLSKQAGYKGVKGFSYARAISDIQIYNPKGSRFNAAISKDPRILKEQTMSVLDFLRAPTSTKVGIDTSFRNSIDTINKKYGTSFTWQEAANFFMKNQATSQFKAANGSPTGLRAIGQIQRLDAEIKKGIEQNMDFKITGPEKNAAIKLLKDRRRKYIGGREYTEDTKIQILKLLDPENKYDWMGKFKVE